MKRKRRGKQLTSLLLSFAMLIGLLSGPVFVRQTAQAAVSDSIALGKLDNKGTYYCYPDASVEVTESGKKFYDLTVTVDSGYFRVPSSVVDGIKGKGILTDGTMDEDDKYDDVSTTKRYEAIMFSWDDGTTKDKIETFIRSIQFVTALQKQTVRMYATTLNDTDKTVKIGGETVYLEYFDGHFYGLVGNNWSGVKTWDAAYQTTKSVTWNGIQGYLATITTRAEDRFIYSTWDSQKGWIGCTRAKLADGSSYTDEVTQWKTLDKIDTSDPEQDFIWRWVSGPEASLAFGYQTHAYGQKGWNGDGAFETYDGEFSNWGNDDNVEPNGGGSTDEAFGYYGQYDEGRWNDYDANQYLQYYIEFGGYEGDDEKIADKLGEVIYSAEEESTGIITDGTYGVETLKGKPDIINNDPYGVSKKGTELIADVTDILEKNASLGVTEEDLTYQWYLQEKNGTPTKIAGATDKNYYLTEEDLGNKLVVRVTVEKNGETYIADSNPYNTASDSSKDKTKLDGSVAIEKTGDASNGDPILKANVDNIVPVAAQEVLDYQWYVVNGDSYIKIPGATEETYTVPEEYQGKQLVVTVTPNSETGEDYEGSVTSTPYLVPDKNTPKEAIKGTVVIQNTSTDDKGNVAVKAGSILTADITGVTPQEAQPTLTYQWFVTDEDGVFQPIAGATYKNYELTADDIDKKVAVIAYADEVNYTGSVSATPYDTARTNADIDIDPNPGSDVDPDNGKRVIKVTPTANSTGYTVWEFITQEVPDDLVVTDEDGNELTPDDEGYYSTPTPGGILLFYVDKDKSYDIKERQIVSENTETLGIHIDDPKTVYDKNTDTISITVDPAKTDYQYAILKKIDGIYQPVTVTSDANGNYVYDSNSQTVWTDGSQSAIAFTSLPADGTYRIVSIPVSAGQDVDPSEILDGSKDVDAAAIKADALKDTGKGNNVTQTTMNKVTYTKAEEDKAEKFIKSYVTDSKKKLITKVNDSTRDIIISGESTWKKMTAREKAAVNAKLKAKGCPYAYDQLLKMAKKWKIPSFNMRKLMKKGTKSKLKMIKCKGATVVTTTTNKKVATISKKGVIKAKKVGKATCTITVIKGKYTNRLVVRLIVKKKFKNAKEIKKIKAKQIKTPTLLLNKQRKLKKSTKIGIVDLTKGSKVTYKSFNKKNFTINKKGRYKAKRLGSSLIRTIVKQNGKKYILYLYLTGIK